MHIANLGKKCFYGLIYAVRSYRNSKYSVHHIAYITFEQITTQDVGAILY